MRKLVLLCIIAFQFLKISAQNKILGRIITKDSLGAANVNIEIKEKKISTTSDVNGNFEIDKLGDGKYTIIVSFTGLQTQQKTILLNNNKSLFIDFKLAENAGQLEEVIITATKNQNEKVAGIGKMPIKIMDLPQSISIIGKDVIDRQQSLRLSDVISNITGINIYGTTGGTQEEIGGRGYAFNSSNTFKNGVRYNNGAIPEISALERVEVLKGSAAILFGNVAPGGVLNLVTKKPKFEKGGEVSFRAGSNDFYKPSFDIYEPINKSIAYRLNSTYENSKSFRDNVKAERIYFNPSLLINAGKKTTVLIEGDFLADNRTLDYGTGAIDYVIANIPRSRFLGAAWSYNKVIQKTATLTITHQLNQNWKITSISSYQNYSNEMAGTTRPNASGQFVKADGAWLRGLQKATTNENYIITAFDVTGNLKTGKIKHILLFGADGDKYITNAGAFVYANAAFGNKNIYDSINIFDLAKYIQRSDIPSITATTITHTPTARLGVYFQDLISISEKIKLLAGLRYTIQKRNGVYTDSLKNSKRVFTSNTSDEAFSPRLGFVYQPTKNISIFTSYSNSFTVNTGTDIFLNPLAPSFIDQYEAGIKTSLFKKMIAANITVYNIANSNLAQISLKDASGNTNNNTSIKELAGEVTSKGLEIEITTKSIHGLQVISGYSFNQTKYTKSNTYITGSKLLYNPQHTANVSLYYVLSNRSFLKGFDFGLSCYYTGERVAGRSTRIQVPNDTYKPMSIPDYFQFDAGVGYRFQKITTRIKLSNIFNQLSYYVHDDNSVNPIAPTQFAATVSIKL